MFPLKSLQVHGGSGGLRYSQVPTSSHLGLWPLQLVTWPRRKISLGRNPRHAGGIRSGHSQCRVCTPRIFCILVLNLYAQSAGDVLFGFVEITPLGLLASGCD